MKKKEEKKKSVILVPFPRQTAYKRFREFRVLLLERQFFLLSVVSFEISSRDLKKKKREEKKLRQSTNKRGARVSLL